MKSFLLNCVVLCFGSAALHFVLGARQALAEYERAVVPFFFYLKNTGWGGGAKYIDVAFLAKDSILNSTIQATQSQDYYVDVEYEKNYIANFLFLRARGIFYDFNSMGFYGFGSDTDKGAITAYKERAVYSRLGLGIHLGPYLRLGTDFRYEVYELSKGQFGTIPSVETRFASFPGFEGTTTTVKARAFLTLNTTDHPLSPERGSLVEIYYETNEGLFNSAFPHHTWSARWVQYYPIRSKVLTGVTHTQVISVRGDDLPIFHRAKLGGYSLLRAYPLQRFVDNQSLLINAELRWNVFYWGMNSFVNRIELAPFFDIGRVYQRRENITLEGMKAAVGLGVRVAFGPGLVVRADTAFAAKDEWALQATFNYPF